MKLEDISAQLKLKPSFLNCLIKKKTESLPSFYNVYFWILTRNYDVRHHRHHRRNRRGFRRLRG
jgi:hypothetical protein